VSQRADRYDRIAAAGFAPARSANKQSIPQNQNLCYRSYLDISSPRDGQRGDKDGAKGSKPLGLSRAEAERAWPIFLFESTVSY
jgi:hypothetical protein